MGMTIDDMYDWLYRLKSELVVYMPKEWHEPMRCSIQDVITFSRKYQMLKADYENRLKADMVAMLEELKEKLREMHEDFFETEHFDEAYGVSVSMDEIQQKINTLKEQNNEPN